MPPAKRSGSRLQRDAYTLTIRQTPDVGKALSGKEKDRKPVDPPPIVQLQIRDYSDPAQNYLQSPYYLCICSLWDAGNDEPASDPTLHGTLVSSLHRLKDSDNTVKAEGEFRLKFVLWELLEGEVQSLQSIISKPFRVYPAKTFPGLSESTFLTRSFSDQGVRLRIRKETRSTISKRTVSEAENSHYATQADAPGLGGAYGQTNPYQSGSYVDYANALVKRQKSAGSSSYGERDPWAQTSPGLYAHPSHSQVSGFYQEPVSGAPQVDYGFRSSSAADPSLTPSYYQRTGLGDYGQSTQQIPYHNQPRSTHADVANGASSYGDNGSFGNMSSADGSQSSQYRYMSGGSVPNVLPPISSASQPSGQVLASSYPTYGADGRYTAMSSNGRSVYNYPGQAYQVPANYT